MIYIMFIFLFIFILYYIHIYVYIHMYIYISIYIYIYIIFTSVCSFANADTPFNTIECWILDTIKCLLIHH